MEIRAGQVKAASPGRLAGYAAVFNSEANLGEFIEIIRPGAFAESLKQGKKIQALYAHDVRSLLGTTPKTLSLSEDRQGLAFDLQLPDTTIGRDVSVLVERGDIEGCSFAFDAIEDRWTKRPDGVLLRELIRVILHEITITADPAYPDTTVAKRSAIAAGAMPLI
jgi:uncharacterized protein